MGRTPAVYIPHGGGPWPFVDFPGLDPGEVQSLRSFLTRLPGALGEPPRAILVVSAHWEESPLTVMNAAHPPLLYDYYGFPKEAYEIEWPAPGSPTLAARVRELLEGAGIEGDSDSKRGFDHGTFVPLKVMYPDAEIPTVQLSLLRGLDPAAHFEVGRALEPLREESVLIVGSGMSFHDLRGFFTRDARAVSEAFDAWLQTAATAEPAERGRQLEAWESAPAARRAHPREEHLLPLMVVAGAAGSDRGALAFNGTFGNARISAFRFG